MCSGHFMLPSVRRPVKQVAGSRVPWVRYQQHLEVVLDMGAAGVVETLLRTTARHPCLTEDDAMMAQVHHSVLCSAFRPSACSHSQHGAHAKCTSAHINDWAASRRSTVLSGAQTPRAMHSQLRVAHVCRRHCLHTRCCITDEPGRGRRLR